MTHLKLQKLQKGAITQQHIDTMLNVMSFKMRAERTSCARQITLDWIGLDVLVGNHLFVIFAVLDVSCAVNSCINHSFLHFK